MSVSDGHDKSSTPALAAARTFVLDYLSDEERHRRQDLLAAGQAAGHSFATLRRAIAELIEAGVIAREQTGRTQRLRIVAHATVLNLTRSKAPAISTREIEHDRLDTNAFPPVLAALGLTLADLRRSDTYGVLVARDATEHVHRTSREAGCRTAPGFKRNLDTGRAAGVRMTCGQVRENGCGARLLDKERAEAVAMFRGDLPIHVHIAANVPRQARKPLRDAVTATGQSALVVPLGLRTLEADPDAPDYATASKDERQARARRRQSRNAHGEYCKRRHHRVDLVLFSSAPAPLSWPAGPTAVLSPEEALAYLTNRVLIVPFVTTRDDLWFGVWPEWRLEDTTGDQYKDLPCDVEPFRNRLARYCQRHHDYPDAVIRALTRGDPLPPQVWAPIKAQVLEADQITREVLIREYDWYDNGKGPGPNPADHPEMARPQLRHALPGIVIEPWQDRVGGEGEPWPCAVVEDGWRCARSGPALYCRHHTAVIARRLNEGDVFLAAAARMISNGKAATAAKLASVRMRHAAHARNHDPHLP